MLVLPTVSSLFQYNLNLTSSDKRLVFLAKYPVSYDGYFEMLLDVSLIVPNKTDDRTMLYLLVCDDAGQQEILAHSNMIVSSPLQSTPAIPSYCALPNRTLGDICTSVGLYDQSPDRGLYYVNTGFTGNFDPAIWSSGEMVYFYIDACETVGGINGILRSCLNQQSRAYDNPSRTCSKCLQSPTINTTTNNCLVPPEIQPLLHIHAQMNICNGHGECPSLSNTALPIAYLVLTITWTIAWIIWTLHIRSSGEALIDLQLKMKTVPCVMSIYSAVTCLSLYTESRWTGIGQTIVVNLNLLSKLAALAIPAEVVVYIAKGWKITRPSLEAKEHQMIRFVTIAWAISYVAIKTSQVRYLILFIVWGISWSSIVFMIWYNSALNMNMLRYQMTLIQQMPVIVTRTPVYTKFMLFRRFRGILGGYVICTCISNLFGFIMDIEAGKQEWKSAVGDEIVNLGLYIALGYTFRCRRFSHLLQVPIAPESGNSPSIQNSSSAIAPLGSLTDTVRTQEKSPQRKRSSRVFVINPNPNEQSLGTPTIRLEAPILTVSNPNENSQETPTIQLETSTLTNSNPNTS